MCQPILEGLSLHGLYETNRGDLIGAQLLTFVTRDAKPYVRILGRGIHAKTIIDVCVPRAELAVELCVAGMLLHHTTDAALQADLRGLDNREIVVSIIFHTDNQD